MGDTAHEETVRLRAVVAVEYVAPKSAYETAKDEAGMALTDEENLRDSPHSIAELVDMAAEGVDRGLGDSVTIRVLTTDRAGRRTELMDALVRFMDYTGYDGSPARTYAADLLAELAHERATPEED